MVAIIASRSANCGRPHSVHCDDVSCNLLAIADTVDVCADAHTDTCTSIENNDDTDFGEIDYIDIFIVCYAQLPSTKITKNRSEHISVAQPNEVLSVLDELTELFSDKPGLCNLYKDQITDN